MLLGRFRGTLLRIAWADRQSEFSLIGIITFVTVLAILCSLGQWQLSRADEKKAVQNRQAAVANAQPVSAPELFSGADTDFRPARVTGVWQEQKTFLLDNSIRGGRAGYEVLTPMAVEGGLVLVNRGWIPRGPVRAELPVISSVEGQDEVEGYLHRPSDRTFTLKDDDYRSPSWPMIIQKIDMRGISSLFSLPLAPVVLRLAPEEGSGMRRDWQIVAMGPEKHQGYALQWFGLAIAWVVIFVVANTNLRRGK